MDKIINNADLGNNFCKKESKDFHVENQQEKTELKLELDDEQVNIIDSILTLTSERDEFKEQWLREKAELENYKKRIEKEKSEFFLRANEKVIKELLPVLDNLERTLVHLENFNLNLDKKLLVTGISMTYKELINVLERYGLEKIIALGELFNPEIHEAVVQQEDSIKKENTILQELVKGYLFQGRLLRPAMVVVSKKPVDTIEESSLNGVDITSDNKDNLQS